MSKRYWVALILLTLSQILNGLERFFPQFPWFTASIISALVSLVLFVLELCEHKKKNKNEG